MSQTKYHETQFFQLPHANNIYSTCVAGVGPSKELFVASRRSLSVLSPRDLTRDPSTSTTSTTPPACDLVELTLTGVPGDSEFLSIDVSPSSRILAVALRQVKPLPGTMIEGSNFSLHFYGASMTSTLNSTWTDIAEDCQRIDVDYTPYCISHLAVSFPHDDNRTRRPKKKSGRNKRAAWVDDPDQEDIFVVSG